MLIPHRTALTLGFAAIAGVVALQAFGSFSCYGHSLIEFLQALGIFLAVPLLPAALSLLTANPLRAVGACALFAPWLGLAYYTDCVMPGQGGGASLAYAAVLIWGTPCAILGALLSGPLLRLLGISVASR